MGGYLVRMGVGNNLQNSLENENKYFFTELFDKRVTWGLNKKLDVLARIGIFIQNFDIF